MEEVGWEITIGSGQRMPTLEATGPVPSLTLPRHTRKHTDGTVASVRMAVVESLLTVAPSCSSRHERSGSHIFSRGYSANHGPCTLSRTRGDCGKLLFAAKLIRYMQQHSITVYLGISLLWHLVYLYQMGF